MYDKNYKKEKPKTVTNHTDFFPIPETTTKLLKTKRGDINFSLFSNRMVKWDVVEKSSGGKLISRKFEVKKDRTEKDHNGKEFKIKSAKLELCDQSKRSFPAAKTFLEKKHKMQEDYLEQLNKEFGIEIFSFDVQTSSPFISGLGSGHPTETGMILDRNIGVPYLPAASIKGVVRTAYAVNIVGESGQANDAEIEKYFGTVDVNKTNTVKRGQLVFMDAYPENIAELKMDIMNPHFGDYYGGEGKKLPTENSNPVPIHFLVVPEGTFFTFRCYYLPFEKNKEAQNEKPQNEEIKKDVEKMFETAFSKIGFGGKTAIGYGRFKKPTEAEQNRILLENERKQENLDKLTNGYEVSGTIIGKKEGKNGISWKVSLNGNGKLIGTITGGKEKLPTDCTEGKIYKFKIVTNAHHPNYNVAYLGE